MPIIVKHSAGAGISGAAAVTGGRAKIINEQRKEAIRKREFDEEMALRERSLAVQAQAQQQRLALSYAQLDAQMRSNQQRFEVAREQTLAAPGLEAAQRDKAMAREMALSDFNMDLDKQWYGEQERMKDEKFKGLEQQIWDADHLSDAEKQRALFEIREQRAGLRRYGIRSRPTGEHDLGDLWVDDITGNRMVWGEKGPEVQTEAADIPNSKYLSFDGAPLSANQYWERKDKESEIFLKLLDRTSLNSEWDDEPEFTVEQASAEAAMRAGLAYSGPTMPVEPPPLGPPTPEEGRKWRASKATRKVPGMVRAGGSGVIDATKFFGNPSGPALPTSGLGAPGSPAIAAPRRGVFPEGVGKKPVGSPAMSTPETQSDARGLLRMQVSQLESLPEGDPLRPVIAKRIQELRNWIQMTHKDWISGI